MILVHRMSDFNMSITHQKRTIILAHRIDVRFQNLNNTSETNSDFGAPNQCPICLRTSVLRYCQGQNHRMVQTSAKQATDWMTKGREWVPEKLSGQTTRRRSQHDTLGRAVPEDNVLLAQFCSVTRSNSAAQCGDCLEVWLSNAVLMRCQFVMLPVPSHALVHNSCTVEVPMTASLEALRLRDNRFFTVSSIDASEANQK